MHTASTNYGDFFVLFAQFVGFGEIPGWISLKVIGKNWQNYSRKNNCKAVSKIMFNALAPIIIFKTQTPQIFEILDVFLLLNAFLGFTWNNSQSLPNFQQHFFNPSFDSGVVICIFSFPPFCCGWNVKWMISTALDLLMHRVWNV